MRTEAIEKQEVFKDPELKDPERPKRVLTHKQMENLALCREKAIEKKKQKGIISKNINDEIKKIQESKRNIRKTLIIEKIKTYSEQGLITAAILTTLLAAPNFSDAQKSKIKQIAKKIPAPVELPKYFYV